MIQQLIYLHVLRTTKGNLIPRITTIGKSKRIKNKIINIKVIEIINFTFIL